MVGGRVSDADDPAEVDAAEVDSEDAAWEQQEDTHSNSQCTHTHTLLAYNFNRDETQIAIKAESCCLSARQTDIQTYRQTDTLADRPAG